MRRPSDTSAPLPSPADLAREDVEAIVRDPARKQGFVTPMFEHIAPRYDAFTRVFSFGMDARWKAAMVRAAVRQGARGEMADLACGTGDLAFALAAAVPDGSIIGIDAASAMIAQATVRARTETAGGRTRFQVGDLAETGLPNAMLDVVTAGYAYRNAPSLDAGLVEAARILRPGGLLCTLDFYRPSQPLWRAVFLRYLRAAGDLVGWWWHRAPIIYGYIAPSIAAWVTVARYEDALAHHGFTVLERRVHLGGGVAWHVARRRADAQLVAPPSS